MLVVGRVAKNVAEARKRIQGVLGNGSALEVFRRMVEAHGGDPRVVDDDRVLPRAPSEVVVESGTSGHVRTIDAERLGLLSVTMGAGRARAEDSVDPAVGIELLARVGSRVAIGEPLAKLHVRNPEVAKPWIAAARQAFSVGRVRVGAKSRILERL